MSFAEAVTYSGPTYVAIRSGIHSSSTASTHAGGLLRKTKYDSSDETIHERQTNESYYKNHSNLYLSTLRNLETILKDEEGRRKPVVLIISDGGPEENPRYPKVISHAINNFVLHNLDAIFIFTNAPGRSAFNRVERRMAPLSRELFYNEPDDSAESFIPDLPSQQWYCEHVVKCDDRAYCGHMRSSIRSILSEPFVIPPYPILQSSKHEGKTFAPFLLRRSLEITSTYEGFGKLIYDIIS
ncbi:hypothetical protein ABMA28_008108 [Loxostege sticticalis]|uniref:VWFA domain-containing protein n=1 Tax=Loxostege sticticalis TaxID=481309 RepID=A0ABD0SGY4_LOXSC